MEHGTGAESNEPMYLHVAGPDPKEVQRAKDLCADLLDNVRKEYEAFKANPPPQRSYNNPYGNAGGDRQNSYGGSAQSYGGYGAASVQSPTTPAPPGTSSAGGQGDYAAQWAQYYGQDPYAQYGGYANYMAYAQQYYAQQQAQGGASSPTPAPPGSAPPGPPAEAPPPPPPNGSPLVANGGYNSVRTICLIVLMVGLTGSRCHHHLDYENWSSKPSSGGPSRVAIGYALKGEVEAKGRVL